MGLNTIMRHLKEADKELCFRSLSNLSNQRVNPTELARECRTLGWRCMLVGDRVFIVKTKTALDEFDSQYGKESYKEL
jgi:hypothetical protein